MNRIIFTCVVLATGISTKISAQRGELTAIDSLSKIVNNPKIPSKEKIKPMTEISRMYIELGDSLNSEKFLNQARTLAKKQKDSGYMIYVLNRRLSNTMKSYPRDITKLYKVIDSIYTAISKTTDIEAQVWGYIYISFAKNENDFKYDFSDSFKALLIVRQLPDRLPEKQTLLFNIYRILAVRNTTNETITPAKKYLDEMWRAAEKTGNKDNICATMYTKLYLMAFALDTPKDEKLIMQNFEHLEQFITQNRNNILMIHYIYSINLLYQIYSAYPNARYEKLLQPHLENCRQIETKNLIAKCTLIDIEYLNEYNRKNYTKAVELLKKLIDLYRFVRPYQIDLVYKNLFELYMQTGQYQQAAEAMNESMKYYKERVNMQIEEQRQLAEVKFEMEKIKLEAAKKQAELSRAQTRNVLYSMVALFGICLSAFVFILFKRRNQRLKLEREYAEQQTKLKEYEKEIVQKQLVAANLQMLKKNETLEKITQQTDDKKVQKLVHTDFRNDKTYTDFEKMFNDIHPDFFEFLKAKAAPNNLTNLDLRYCAYIYLNKGNKEISNELNVSNNTVVSNKKKLRKKLNLEKQSDFKYFFSRFTPPPPPLTDFNNNHNFLTFRKEDH
ncbi:MAG: LuxR C-terminal-related transcriptional regulator [Flavobacteriaceae bacterium]|jgi:DNA-binding CsgD family transcriptional regulator|nr:LuxR C-terminal-related transcriptional regulator [Flavobacteriaceae bacterium]